MGDSIVQTKGRISDAFSQAVVSDLRAAERILFIVSKSDWRSKVIFLAMAKTYEVYCLVCISQESCTDGGQCTTKTVTRESNPIAWVEC